MLPSNMVDRAGIETSLSTAWRSLGTRAAVTGGSLAALISLFHHVPVSTAALRGGAAWIALLVGTRIGALALGYAERFDEMATESDND